MLSQTLDGMQYPLNYSGADSPVPEISDLCSAAPASLAPAVPPSITFASPPTSQQTTGAGSFVHSPHWSRWSLGHGEAKWNQDGIQESAPPYSPSYTTTPISELALLWTHRYFFFSHKHASNVSIEFIFSLMFFDIVLSNFSFGNTEVGLSCTSAVLVILCLESFKSNLRVLIIKATLVRKEYTLSHNDSTKPSSFETHKEVGRLHQYTHFTDEETKAHRG